MWVARMHHVRLFWCWGKKGWASPNRPRGAVLDCVLWVELHSFSHSCYACTQHFIFACRQCTQALENRRVLVPSPYVVQQHTLPDMMVPALFSLLCINKC